MTNPEPNCQTHDVWPDKWPGRPDAEHDHEVPNPPAPHSGKYTAEQEAARRSGG